MSGIHSVRTALLLSALFLVPGEALAQRGELKVFFGFGFVGVGIEQGSDVTFEKDRLNTWGIHGDLAYGLSDNVDLVLDGSWPNGSVRFQSTLLSGEIDVNQAIYLAGPRFTFGSGKLRPSIQGLAGLAISSADRVQLDAVDQPIAAGLNETSFAGAVDLNLDFSVSNSVAIRLIQAGVVFSKLGGKSQASPRLSAGAVVSF